MFKSNSTLKSSKNDQLADELAKLIKKGIVKDMRGLIELLSLPNDPSELSDVRRNTLLEAPTLLQGIWAALREFKSRKTGVDNSQMQDTTDSADNFSPSIENDHLMEELQQVLLTFYPDKISNIESSLNWLMPNNQPSSPRP